MSIREPHLLILFSIRVTRPVIVSSKSQIVIVVVFPTAVLSVHAEGSPPGFPLRTQITVRRVFVPTTSEACQLVPMPNNVFYISIII